MSYFNNINHSILFYQLNGYTYIDSPWLVSEQISNLTKPQEKNNFFINKKCLVASGEQSFLQLINDDKIKPGSYVSTTPCFRDEAEDDTHKTHFMKTELIIWDYNNVDFEQKLTKMTKLCLEFFSKYLPCKIVQTEQGFDVVDETFNIELGSYGVREDNLTNSKVYWIYGTGLAEPRLSYVLNKLKKPGYHNTIIPKYDVGDFGKILEETSELTDAVLSNNKIMTLVELSDLYGAIEHYVIKNFGMSMNDVKIMNNTTQRAFINGRR